MNVKALPEFVGIFKASQNISTVNGRSHFLIKSAGKLKWEEVKKDDGEQLQEEIKLNDNLRREIEKLKDKIEYFKQREDELGEENSALYDANRGRQFQNEDEMN